MTWMYIARRGVRRVSMLWSQDMCAMRSRDQEMCALRWREEEVCAMRRKCVR
jgi:hypothetical protein